MITTAAEAQQAQQYIDWLTEMIADNPDMVMPPGWGHLWRNGTGHLRDARYELQLELHAWGRKHAKS